MLQPRELLEETGCSGQLRVVAHTPADTYNTMGRHHFVATNFRQTASIANDEHEFIQVRRMSPSDFKEHLRQGQLTDASTGYIGLDYLSQSNLGE